ncbi:alpha/beta hydrolase [Acidipila sp. EB88]|uniref:alpha/beta hydrolase n=1 Tax=Acidipila sp. EB88 TaxID=2305226 RepID=UPI000F5FD1B0|nr:alpha/beta fold hydrolase [Acidipila sp. EB88]RRA49246.1 alpha/beta fold hydrolase [Acidipila sp. EB88]
MNRSVRLLLSLAFSVALLPALHAQQTQPAASVTAAITADPVRDAQHPAQLVELTVPSHGAAMNAVFYLAAGRGPHPVVLLLHGFPGNEQNLDLAQAMRRAGWSVLTFHYRGAWGSPGAFSFTHADEDTSAAIAFLRDPAIAAKYALDPSRIVVIGHSMGGFLALHAAANRTGVAGVAALSAWNIGAEASHPATVASDRSGIAGMRAESAPLQGCTPEGLWSEIKANAGHWNYIAYAPALKQLPVLMVESDDDNAPANHALAAALRAAGDTRVMEKHFVTDHSYSDRRIALETTVLQWLATLARATTN